MWHNEGASCHGNKPLSGMWPSQAHTHLERTHRVKGREGDRLDGREFSGGITRVVPHELCGTRKKARGCPKPPERGIKFTACWVF